MRRRYELWSRAFPGAAYVTVRRFWTHRGALRYARRYYYRRLLDGGVDYDLDNVVVTCEGRRQWPTGRLDVNQ